MSTDAPSRAQVPDGFRSADPTGTPLPTFLVVSDDAAVRNGLTADLAHRFAGDYDVTDAPASTAGEALRRSAAEGRVMALVIVDERGTDPPALELCATAHRLHPAAMRVLLIRRGSYSSMHPLVTALALGQVDYHLYCPWAPLERVLSPAVSDFLAAWHASREAPVVPLRIVGPARAARSHDIRDKLSRAAVPYWFYDTGSDEGRQLLAETGRDGSRQPRGRGPRRSSRSTSTSPTTRSCDRHVAGYPE